MSDYMSQPQETMKQPQALQLCQKIADAAAPEAAPAKGVVSPPPSDRT